MTEEDRSSFADRCRTSLGHLKNVASGKACSAVLAIDIERESGGEVRCEEMNDEADWAFIRGLPKLKKSRQVARLRSVS